MKRLIAVFLIIAALFCVALAESDFVGTWVGYNTTDDGGMFVEMFIFTKNHYVYYLNQKFNQDGIHFGADYVGFGRQYVGQWIESSTGVIEVLYGESARCKMKLLSNDFIGQVVTGGYIPYARVPDWPY